MGLAGSKGLLSESQGSSTPVSCKSHVLAMDPRSPSEEFPRTPIAIDDEYCIATSLPEELDPRSPAVGFERTPIPGQESKVIQDPRSPTSEVPRTPLEKFSYDYSDVEEEDDAMIILEDVPVKCSNRLNFVIAEDTIEQDMNKRNLMKDSAWPMEGSPKRDTPRTPLAVSNRPNSLRIRVQHKQHQSKMASICASTKQPQQLRQYALVESIDKENSPLH